MGKRRGGKSKVGKFISLGLAIAGAFAPQIFGLAKVANGAFKAALYGLSLGSTIGSVFDKPKDFGTTTQGAFDAKMNRVDGTAMLPIIYGTQKAGGMQTYHRTNHNGRVLYKHVLVCEGEIQGVRGVAVNSYLCPYTIENYGKTNTPQVFGLKNTLYEDATVQVVDAGKAMRSSVGKALKKDEESADKNKPKLSDYARGKEGVGHKYIEGESKEQAIERYNKDLSAWESNSRAYREKRKKYLESINKYKDMRTGNDKVLVLYANGEYDAVLLQHPSDMREDKANEMFTSFAGVYQYIIGDSVENTIKEHGWELVNPVNCQDAPEKLQTMGETSAYNRTVYCSLSSDMIARDSHFTVHLGDSNQSAPNNYMAVGGYPSMAYVDGSIKWTEEVGSGNPTVTMLVDGRTLYDPRIKGTRFSKNPALVLMDYLTNPVYGAGQYITREMLDIDSFIDVANYCDELVYYENQFGHMVKEPRYEIDLVLQERRSHLDNIKDILRCFAGFIVFSNDKICLRVERSQTPVYHFDKDNIVEKSLAYKGAGIDQSPNKLLITYVEPALDYNAVRVIVEDSVNQLPPPIGRGRAVEQEIQLAGVARQSQALRLGKIYRDIIRLCPITVTFKTGAMAMHLEAGDIITLTKSFIDENGVEQNIFDRFQCRIIEMREEQGTYEITARQYNPSIYDDKHGATLKPLNVLAYNKPVKLTPTDVERVPYAQADVRFVQSTAGVGRYDLIISWQIPDGNYAKGRLSYKAKDVNTEWVLAGDFETVGTIYNVMYGKSYDIKIETVDSKGIVHEEAVTKMSDILITNNTAQPSNVTNFRLESTDKITASWDSPSDATQIMYYELRTDDKVGNDGDSLITRTVSNKTEISLKDRTGKIYVYVRNLLGTYSSGYIHSYDFPKLEAPRFESHKDILGGVSLQFNVKPVTAKELHIKVGNALYISQTNQYNFMGSAGIYDMTFCWVDYFGECVESGNTRITIQANIPQEYLTEQANAIRSVETKIREIESIRSKIDGIDGKFTSFDSKLGALQANYNTTATWATQTHKRVNQAIADLSKIDNKIATAITSKTGEISSKVVQLESLINQKVEDVKSGVSTQISQLSDTVNTSITNKLKGVETHLTQTDNAITKAIADSKSYTNSQVTQLSNSIDSKVNNATSGLSTRITQLDNAIDSKVANANKNISTRITQLEGSIDSKVSNGLSGVSSQITQLTNSIDLKVQNGINSLSGDTLVSRINLSSNGTRIDGKLLHVTGQALFDDNIVTSKMLQAKAVTADKIKVDSLSAISANVGTLKGGTIIGTTLKNENGTFSVSSSGDIVGAKINGSTITGTTIQNASGTFSVSPDGVIKGATIDAQSFRKSGLEFSAIRVETYTVADESLIPIPDGFSREDCKYTILGSKNFNHVVSKSMMRYIWDDSKGREFMKNFSEPKDLIIVGYESNSNYPNDRYDITSMRIGINTNYVAVAKRIESSHTSGENNDYDSQSLYRGYIDILCIATKK